MKYCCQFYFLNVLLLDSSIHFFDRSDHKEMMEEPGDSQQSGYPQCTVRCAVPDVPRFGTGWLSWAQQTWASGCGWGQTRRFAVQGAACHCSHCMLKSSASALSGLVGARPARSWGRVTWALWFCSEAAPAMAGPGHRDLGGSLDSAVLGRRRTRSLYPL